MIFVTVGTHEQPFNRLIEYIDHMKQNEIIKEDVIMQTGYSTYKPKSCTWSSLLSYKKMQDYVKNARIVITHGGPSSIFMPLQLGKVPVVVPRQKVLGEHINDHQVEFLKALDKRMKILIPVYEIEELQDKLTNYDVLSSSIHFDLQSNNCNFNCVLEKMVEELWEKNK